MSSSGHVGKGDVSQIFIGWFLRTGHTRVWPRQNVFRGSCPDFLEVGMCKEVAPERPGPGETPANTTSVFSMAKGLTRWSQCATRSAPGRPCPRSPRPGIFYLRRFQGLSTTLRAQDSGARPQPPVSPSLTGNLPPLLLDLVVVECSSVPRSVGWGLPRCGAGACQTLLRRPSCSAHPWPA